MGNFDIFSGVFQLLNKQSWCRCAMWRHCNEPHNFCSWMLDNNRILNIISHYSDVIMGVMAYQITSLTVVYSIVYSGADQRKHQSSASLAFERGIHRSPVNSPHKWPVTRKMFPFDNVIMHIISYIERHILLTSSWLRNRNAKIWRLVHHMSRPNDPSKLWLIDACCGNYKYEYGTGLVNCHGIKQMAYNTCDNFTEKFTK